MEKNRKIELQLQGVTCACCAAKINKDIKKIPGATLAGFHFATGRLEIEIATSGDPAAILNSISAIVASHVPGAIIREKSVTGPAKKVLILAGLDCANCSAKIERALCNLPGVKTATIDFATKKLTFEARPGFDLQALGAQAVQVVAKIESGVKICEPSALPADSSQPASNRSSKYILFTSIVLFIAGLLSKSSFPVELTLFTASYLLAGGGVLRKALRNICRGQIFDENFLMTIATLGAFGIGEFPEAAAVMLFYRIGETFQSAAVNRSRQSISALMDIRPDYANVSRVGEIVRVLPEEVQPGETIIVKPGEKIPLDGIVNSGTSVLDTSALTGESRPRTVRAGEEVLSGMINTTGLLTVTASKNYADSTVSKILDLIQNASSRKAPVENFITKFARYYTPLVVSAALILAVLPPLLNNGSFSEWIGRALIFLVVSCPCALVVSIPLSFFGGIGAASRKGILIKGSNYLEALNAVQTIVFDKTGTLTNGVFSVVKICPTPPFDKSEILALAAGAESYSNHPVARSILKAFGKKVDKNPVENYEEISGYGIRANVNGRLVLAGNARLLQRYNITFVPAGEPGTIVYIAVDNQSAGYLVIADAIKKDAPLALQQLRAAGIQKTVLLTGDNADVAQTVALELGIDEIHAGLLPQQKVEQLENIRQSPESGKVLFVGDGINDAPVLAMADIGVAMGGLGSAAAIEAADIVLMTDEPSKLATAIKIAVRTRRIIWQNISLALIVKTAVMLLGACGIATMWEAVFADVGVTLLAVSNTLRLLKS